MSLDLNAFDLAVEKEMARLSPRSLVAVSSTPMSPMQPVKSCKRLLDAAAEVDAVLVAHGKKAKVEMKWLAAKRELAAKDALVREPILMDDPKTLPEWFADLKSCAEPVRTVKRT